MARAITKAPNLSVSGLGAPKRKKGTYKMLADWNVPSELKKNDNVARAEGLEVTWTLGINGKDPHKVVEYANESRKSSTINLDNFKVGRTTYTRNSFYPVTNKKLSSVTVKVTPTNNKGKGKSAKSARKFKRPTKPTIDAFTFNTETGVVTTKINSKAGTGYRERYDTWYKREVNKVTYTEDPLTHEKTATSEKTTVTDTTTATEKTITYNAADYQQLSYDDYIEIKITARTRGFAGNCKEDAVKTYYVSYPNKATINKIKCDGTSSADKCTVYIDTNHEEKHPVDRVRLDYLANCEYATKESIPADAGWTNSNIVDDAKCTALAIPVGDVMPDRGNHTWVRITSWHANEEVLYRYSEYAEIIDLYVAPASAEDDEIVILDASGGANGTSAVLQLGWNADGQDDSTGTELTWSDEEDTWKSTEQPSSYEFTWSDGALTKDGVTYRDSATIIVKNLQEATKYYFKARRYLEDEDGTTYSRYSNTKECMTVEQPESITAICDDYIPRGKPLPVRWTLAGRGMQTEWRIMMIDGTTRLAGGENAIGSAQIDANTLASHVVNNQLTFTVEASTGSGFVSSESHTITIIDPPECQITSTSLVTSGSGENETTELTSSLFSINLTANRECDLLITVESDGASGQFPQGFLNQVDGDVIYSNKEEPVWTAGQNSLTATITLPTGLDFWDLGRYTLRTTAVDRETRLQTELDDIEFAVNFTNKAVDAEAIDDAVTLTVIDETDEGGDHTQAVEIALAPPEGSSQTDVYDIYRMDVENPHLIGTSFPLTCTTTDYYAPFGSDVPVKYRIAIRTVDGSVSFSDIEYEAICDRMRFDWADGSLELPFGLTFGDSFKKSVNIRAHLDGSMDGYWNQNIERKASLSSDIIKIVQPKDVESARKLARYAGAVFVRLPNGSAFEADVQVTDLSKKNDAVVSVAFDATEIGLTEEFSLPVPYELEV